MGKHPRPRERVYLLKKFQPQRKTKPVQADQPLQDSIEKNRVHAPPLLFLPSQKADDPPGSKSKSRHESAQHRTDGIERAAKHQGQLAYPDQFVDQAGRPGEEQAKIRYGYKKGMTGQVHGGDSTMDFEGLSHIRKRESTRGERHDS